MIKEKIKELADEQKWNHNITLPDGTQTSPVNKFHMEKI